ncbi:hypothetical protein ENSA5_36050 [Enhygromyxa salina]|uniref:Phospholipase D-like domain-containing protein n=1 Tax=Enhygromyxa salina TaxID=215803 RepID=A0A2S9XUH6_9BACT|nr:phospholipase D-like domain-containing protein DpdK [Enhygromyxa salina]PRP96529.1 hypothetical protein ENSA5_36050 [Enhygromyxa salina]
MTVARDIFRHSRYARNEVRELLQSVFVAELLKPSPELWLVSPWLSDIEVIRDTAGAFGALTEGDSTTTLTMSAALTRLAMRGTLVRVVTRPRASTEIYNSLARRGAMGLDNFAWREASELHTKGLVGHGYRVMGSMNFTFSGVDINDEAVRFDRDNGAIARTRLQFEHDYGGLDARS